METAFEALAALEEELKIRKFTVVHGSRGQAQILFVVNCHLQESNISMEILAQTTHGAIQARILHATKKSLSPEQIKVVMRRYLGNFDVENDQLTLTYQPDDGRDDRELTDIAHVLTRAYGLVATTD